MTRSILIAIICLLSLIAPRAMAAGFDHSALDGLLKSHVSSRDGGRSTVVDYAGIGQSLPALKAYLDTTAKVSQQTFDGWPKPEQLAFLINVYNARTLELVLEGYPGIASIKDLGSLLSSPWQKSFVPLFGKTMSLDDIENRSASRSGLM